MRTIKASEFKAKCLSLMDEVARSGELLIVTKNGKPIAELRPYSGAQPATPIGLHRGAVELRGDIIEPLASDDWDVLR